MRSLVRSLIRCALALLAVAAPGAVATDVSLVGTIDLHCHTGPDALPRSIDDVELARLARDAGMRAIVLKNHYTATADRAALAMRAVPGLEIFGGVALNRAVGGLNPEAVLRLVEMDGKRGRIVWLPTWDAANALRRAGEQRPGVAVMVEGKLVPALAEIFRIAAQHDLVIATGHSSASETLALIDAARAAGVKHVLVTHALAGSLDATNADLREMARRGAMLEFVWLQHHPPKPGPNVPAAVMPKAIPLARCTEAIRFVGAEHIVLASDFGQATNPPPPQGLRDFMTALREAGITAEQIDLMVRKNPARLLGLQ